MRLHRSFSFAVPVLFTLSSAALSGCGSDSKSSSPGTGGASSGGNADSGSGSGGASAGGTGASPNGGASSGGGNAGGSGNEQGDAGSAGGTSNLDAGADAAGPPQIASQSFTTGTASTLDVPGGGLLIVPRNSLKTNAALNVSVRSSVYDFGPTGTTFTDGSPVYLELPVPGTLGVNQTAVVETKEAADSTWTDLPTIVSHGMAYAAAAHFSQFTVRIVSQRDVCPSFDSTCGTGNVVGTWNVAGFCKGELDPSVGSSLLAACTGMTTTSPMSSGGSITLNQDLTFSANLVVPYHTVMRGTLSGSCISSYASCDAVATDVVGTRLSYLAATCTGTIANGCDCEAVMRPPVGPEASSGTYTLSGGKMGFSTGIPARDFCVNNSQLSYSWGSNQSTQFGFVLTH